jgi:hypothetical protein
MRPRKSGRRWLARRRQSRSARRPPRFSNARFPQGPARTPAGSHVERSRLEPGFG